MDADSSSATDDEDEDHDAYLSFSDSDDEKIGEESVEDRRARENERQLVLQAAGLVVNEDVKPPASLTRARSERKRRPAPAAPHRARSNQPGFKELPPVPISELESELEPAVEEQVHVDDAYDRYEAYKAMHSNLNRLSIVSTDTSSSTPPLSPLSPAPTISKESSTRGTASSAFFGLIGRKTPANEIEKKPFPTISAPILNNVDTPSRETSPAFGSVRNVASFVVPLLITVLYSVLG